MMDLIRSIIIYALVVALIVAFSYFYKNSDRIVIEPTDHSMDESGYVYGKYAIKAADDYKGGDGFDVVAYWVPGQPAVARVAKVLAIAGEKVEFDLKNPSDPKSALVTKVNGKIVRGFSIEGCERAPEFVVPRGCLYLLADKPLLGQDSTAVGPVPLYCVRGKVAK